MLSDVDNLDIDDVAAGFNIAMDSFNARGSNWVMTAISEVIICHVPYLPMLGVILLGDTIQSCSEALPN